MNGHFVMLQQLVGRQIKKANMRPGGGRHDALLLLSTITNIASSGSNDFQILNSVRLFGIKGTVYIPHADCIIATGRRRQISRGVHLTRPYGPLVALKGANSVACTAIAQHGHFVIMTGTQQKGTLLVFIPNILQLGQRTSVAWTDNGDLSSFVGVVVTFTAHR